MNIYIDTCTFDSFARMHVTTKLYMYTHVEPPTRCSHFRYGALYRSHELFIGPKQCKQHNNKTTKTSNLTSLKRLERTHETVCNPRFKNELCSKTFPSVDPIS